jgi:hypothetical protein
MPHLQDLPPETIQNIMHELVMLDIDQAWKQRNVSRAFAAEISYAFGRLKQTEILACGWRTLFTVRKQWLYLYYRTKVLLDASPTVPDHVNKMIDWLCASLGVEKTDEVTRNRFAEALCKVIAKKLGMEEFESIVGMIKPSAFLYCNTTKLVETTGLVGKIHWEDKVAAAAAIGNCNLLKSLLRDHKTVTCARRLFGSPLYNAATLGHEDIITVMTDHQTIQRESPLNVKSTVDYSVRLESMKEALQLDNVKVMLKLVEFHRNWENYRLYKPIYNALLLQAVTRRKTEMVKALMKVCIYTSTPKTSQHD